MIPCPYIPNCGGTWIWVDLGDSLLNIAIGWNMGGHDVMMVITDHHHHGHP